MWGRIGGVAGNIRSNVSHLAKDILEGDDDSPRQGFGYELSQQNTQPPLERPLQQASQQQQRPYFQAAGVDHARPAADARPPLQQQVPLQQIPFYPQLKARGQPGFKPALFVPGQPGSHPASATSPPAVIQRAPVAVSSQAIPLGRQTPVVSSRLSALKARLDTDKQKAVGEPNKTARAESPDVSGAPVAQGSPSQPQAAEPPSKPQIPFFTGGKTASSSSSSAHPSAHPLVDNSASQLSSSHIPQPPLPPSAPPPRQADGPGRHVPAPRPQPSSSQHHQHDLGFEDVDLDSPDANVSMKTRSDQSQPTTQNHITPIPFMQQHSPRGRAPASTLQTEDFDLMEPDSAVSPSQQAEPKMSNSHPPPVESSSIHSGLPGPAVHVTMAGNQLQHGSESYESYESTHGSSSPAQPAGLLPEMALASAAGPFSTYSGPGSTSSSTPASPGGGSGVPPSRRSSFLPRGMSTHLHKALKATAAAASKASAAIAPPPNAPLPPPTWQEGASPQPIHKGEQEAEFPFQPPWGPSGPASTGNQGRKEETKPWWQQQLRNLQQNLHSPPQLQSDAATDSDVDSAPGVSHLLLDGPPGMTISENGAFTEDSNAQPDDQQTGPMPPPTGVHPWSPDRAKDEHSGLFANSSHQDRQGEVDSMRIMESLGDGVSMGVPQQQGGTPMVAANSELLDLPGAKQQHPTEDALIDSGQDATADSQVEEPSDTPSSPPVGNAVNTPPWSQATESAQAMPDAFLDTASTSAEQQPHLFIPFTTGAGAAAGAASDAEDDDLVGSAAMLPSDEANLSLSHNAHATPQDPGIMQDHPSRPEDDPGAASSSIPQGSSSGNLTQQLSHLQQQLQESQQRSNRLQSALESFEASRVFEQQQHEQQLQLLSQQASQHQTDAAKETKRCDSLQQRLHESQQHAQKLQQQLSQQLKEMHDSESETAGLKDRLKQAQRQLLAAQDELASNQQQADSQMGHQLQEKQQALHEAEQALQSAQAEVEERKSELGSSETELQSMKAELQSMRAELQASEGKVLRAQQQASELDELKATHTQLRHAHAQLQEQHLELTKQHRQQTDGSAHADVVTELTSEVQQARQDLAGQRAKTMALQQALEDQGEDMEAAAAAAVASAAASEDLHANLESQLRASRADVGRLQNEVKRLQAAATAAASHMTDTMTSPLGRDNNMSFLEQEDSSRLKSRLEASESRCNALQKEVAHLRAKVAAAGVPAASTQAAAVELELPVSRDGSQTASSSGRTAGGRDTLPNGLSQGVGQEGPAVVPADGSAHEGLDDDQLQQRLTAAEQDRDKARKQLNRLKQQMMAEQEDEEEKVKWRVDAEVKLAMQEFKAAESVRSAGSQGEHARLRDEVSSSNAQIQQMHADLQAWEQAVSSRDTELRNLQAALGELTFESEAADRLRGELRFANSQVAQLQQQLQEAAGQLHAAEEAAAQARQLASDASHGTEEQRRAEKQLQEEAAMLRRALNESMRRVASLSSEGNAQVDRRIVVKLLVTFFERGQSQEVLQLMARILAFTDEDKARVGLTRQRRGVFSRVAGALALTSPSSKAASTAADDSLADQWLDFLIQQADAADAAESAAASTMDSSITSTPPRSRKSLSLNVSPRAPPPLHDWSSTQTHTQLRQQT